MPPFVPGLTLSQHFFEEAVRPILARCSPALRYAAALIGPGSEVLGYDTEQSTDHGWGPRLQLFVQDHAAIDAIHSTLAEELPLSVLGYPTNFVRGSDGSWLLAAVEQRPVAHRVEVATLDSWCKSHLGTDSRRDWTPEDWLCTPQQRLLTTTGGAVFHDGTGELTALRNALARYPEDVWRYMLAAQWMRIAQHEAFTGRTAQAGDDAGSSLVAARIVQDAMRLAFLLERRYWPYDKWFGTAFRELEIAPELTPHIAKALRAQDWHERQRWLSPIYEALARAHNGLGLGPPIAAEVSRFYGRPFNVIHGARFAEQAQAAIASQAVLRLPPYVGSIDQFVSSTDVLERPELWRRVGAIYGPPPANATGNAATPRI